MLMVEREERARRALINALRDVERAERKRDEALVAAVDARLQAPELADLLGGKAKSRWTVYRAVDAARQRLAA